MEHIVFIGMGSNKGDKISNLRKALTELNKSPKIDIEKISSWYRTAPKGYVYQSWFINGAIQIKTAFSVYDLLKFLKNLEYKMGRRTSFKNAPRLIDLDILFYDDKVINEAEISVPHPRIPKRAFVLVPLAEINPELIHPVTGKRIVQLINELPDKELNNILPF
ncbi:MAG: 2-amino-4-hydroxy-6-hydroxymethyldihydropteridine diphosphokinase [Deltaproteobacteria bacterium]|nr:MAG: 2-amino-4-hydroxy-6-hydroxymethyldihydropteridine diphosphokinase [Deltaproteobacteria bacterium]